VVWATQVLVALKVRTQIHVPRLRVLINKKSRPSRIVPLPSREPLEGNYNSLPSRPDVTCLTVTLRSDHTVNMPALQYPPFGQSVSAKKLDNRLWRLRHEREQMGTEWPQITPPKRKVPRKEGISSSRNRVCAMTERRSSHRKPAQLEDI
jgi:hypothetical protein